jgi:hypothetical protein
MNFGDDQNPYVAPTAGAELHAKRGFTLSDEARKLIATTATLMIVAGGIQLISGIMTLVRDGFTTQSLITVALFGVVPTFTAIAGFSLRAVGKPGDDVGSLLSGFRQLHIAYLVKGIALIVIVALFLLALLAMFLDVGLGMFSMFN